MSSVYAKRQRLYFRLKVSGKWVCVATEFKVGQERAARAMLAKLDARRDAGVETIGDIGPVTVTGYCAVWLKARAAHVQTWRNDEGAMVKWRAERARLRETLPAPRKE